MLFVVKDMSCGHCVASITRAVQAVDPGAEVQINLADHQVDIRERRATADQLRAAIEDAGFTPEPVPMA